MQIFRPTFTHSPCVVILFGHAPLLQLGPGCAARLLHCSDAYVCTKEEKKKEWAKFRQRLTILFDESHEFRKTDTKTLLHNNNTPRLLTSTKLENTPHSLTIFSCFPVDKKSRKLHPMSSLQSATFVTKLTRLGGGLKLQFPALIYDFNVSASLSEMSWKRQTYFTRGREPAEESWSLKHRFSMINADQ